MLEDNITALADNPADAQSDDPTEARTATLTMITQREAILKWVREYPDINVMLELYQIPKMEPPEPIY